MVVDKIKLVLNRIIQDSIYENYLVRNWVYKEKVNVLDFTFYGINFAIEVRDYGSRLTIAVVDRNADICKSFFGNSSRRHNFLQNFSEKNLESSINIILSLIVDRLQVNYGGVLCRQLDKYIDQNIVLQKSLSNFSANIDYNFNKWFDQDIIIKKAIDVREATFKGNVYIKKFKDRPEGFSGLTKQQSFLLELNCLSEINRIAKQGMKHFPKLIDFNKKNCTIVTSCNGISLAKLQDEVSVKNVFQQCKTIVSILQESRVVHLDDHESGKNIVVNENGIITLIDFDIAIVDDISTSLFFEKRRDMFNLKNGYTGFLERMINIIESNEYIKLV